MKTFILNATSRCHEYIVTNIESALKNEHETTDDDSPLLAAICVPLVPKMRLAKLIDNDDTRDEAIAALVVIRREKVGQLRSGIVKNNEAAIVASCYKICVNGFDSFGTSGIEKLSGKMMAMASVVSNPFAWHIGNVNDVLDSFAGLFPNGRPKFV